MFLSLLDLMRRGGALTAGAPRVSPVMDLRDEGDVIRLRASLPGIDRRSVQVQVREASLAIGGHATMEEETEGPGFVRMQKAVRQFYQEMPLPGRVNPNRATATWENGDTLVVHMPKR